MPGATIYPRADHEIQWFADDYPGIVMPRIEKLLWHTTETSNWPRYQDGASAPTLTYHPWLHRWRQHFPLNRSARALRDPQGTPVRENRDGVVQVEIICYCEPGKRPHVTDLDDQALDDLAEFAAFLNREWGLPLQNAPIWLPYPQSGRKDSPARMTSQEYDLFRGILGHQHASGNTHGDPGALPVGVILARAQRLVKPAPPESDGGGWKAPRDAKGRKTMSFEALKTAARQSNLSGWYAQYRHSAMASLKALGFAHKDAPDSEFPLAWAAMEKAIRRQPADVDPDIYSFEWFVDKVAFWPPDNTPTSGVPYVRPDWPATALDR